MKYQFTDFYYWEQPLVDQLRSEGKYVYNVIDTGGIHYSISTFRVNRYGFIITDEALPLVDGNLSDTDFMALGGEEVSDLKQTKIDMTDILAKAKAEYEAKEKEEEEFENTLYDFKNSDNTQDGNNSLHFNEEELQDIYMTCSYAYELMRDDGYTREEVEKKLSFNKYLFFALKYIDNHLSISEIIEKYAKEYFALKENP